MTWPALPLEPWRETQETLHLWTQIIGKVRLALSPVVNHWWSAALQVTPRGLGTGILHHGATPVEIRFDFTDHRLVIDVRRERRSLALEPRSVADFHREVLATLSELGAPVRIHPAPNEVADPIPFQDDDLHAAYDPAAVQRFHSVLVLVDRAFRRFRAGWIGKTSPVHFFWGSFDLAVTRFSGRTAPPHPGGIPHLPDWVVREAYSHENTSAGWWPGNGAFGRPAVFAYAYPEPDGYRDGAPLPDGAFYHEELREYLLPWDDIIATPDPDDTLRAFLEGTHARAADAGGWDRAAQERSPEDARQLERRLRSGSGPIEG